MVDAHDDLATAKRPFRVIACMAVQGRHPLLELTIKRLYQKNDVYRVICTGDRSDREVCERAGAVFIPFQNNPLGAKWNRAFQESEKFDPDACLFVGSSDWLSDNWIHKMKIHVERFDLAGKLDMYLLDIGDENRACYWPGYDKRRKNETIGIGRLLSRRMLDRIHFKPFEDRLNNSLDYSMQVSVMRLAGSLQVVKDDSMKSLSISTNVWSNKHIFTQHYNGILKSEKITQVQEFINNNFPEANQLCESLKATSVKA
jgi:hypothetical protein